MTIAIDHAARDHALSLGLPPSLLFPVGARDEAALATYVGEIKHVVVDGAPRKALLIQSPAPPPVDARFPIWDQPGSAILRARRQLWVHVGYAGYRRAYKSAFPHEDIEGKVLSHAVNRRIASVMGFSYVRITPVSRGCNSSSSFSEQWGVTLHSSSEQAAANRRRGAFIHYADLVAMMVMLDMKPGGGFMDAVNEAQKLVRPRTPG